MQRIPSTVFVLILLAFAGSKAMAATKDQSRLSESEIPAAIAQNATPLPLPSAENGTEQAPASGQQTEPHDGTDQPDAGAFQDESEDGLSLGDIPEVKTVELTADMAKRALDTYLLVSEKYKDSDLEAYDDLQDFVDKNEQGKNFEADIKAAGFATVDEWNTAITTLGFAYTGVVDDPTGEIKLQIEEIQKDNSIAQDLRDRMIASLNAMIPSENNKKVAEELMKDPAYAEKLKQLDTAEGE